MRDFWGNIVPLAGIACLAFFIYGIWQVMSADLKQNQLRYEQCIAADKQWVQGSCVR